MATLTPLLHKLAPARFQTSHVERAETIPEDSALAIDSTWGSARGKDPAEIVRLLVTYPKVLGTSSMCYCIRLAVQYLTNKKALPFLTVYPTAQTSRNKDSQRLTDRGMNGRERRESRRT